MPVGPELPPHLVKRKRSIDDDEHPNSPPHKLQAATAPRTLGPTLPPSRNPDELDVDDSSDDDYGPSGPAMNSTRPVSPPPKRVLGPAPPPQAKNPEELDIEESSEDDYGPSKPTSKASPPPKRILGPAPPPAPLSSRPPNPADSDSDSDDDYGPSLPPPPGSAAEASLFAAQKQERETAAADTASAKPQRAEWMLVPPTDSDWSSRVDPTKLKNRKFQSGKGAKAPSEKSGISAIWTETPEQKRQRLADEVLGRAEVATSSRGGKERPEGESREDEETSRRIREYNEKMRGKSLFEERRERKEKDGTKEEEDDPSKRGFDREKDMALGGRMGHGEKREMLAKAKDFGSRFQKGSFL
ncbi:Protein of unknown function (DUF3752) domain containing protein [Hyaloscypha variabilis]|jgi:hypothetical protein